METTLNSEAEKALAALKSDLLACASLENALHGKGDSPDASRVRNGKVPRKRSAPGATPALRANTMESRLRATVSNCKQSRSQAVLDAGLADETTDKALSQYTRHTDGIALEVFAKFLHYLAEAIPMPGSGVTLPLDLTQIASRCTGSFYAPRRFAAVQLAYHNPRCRVLIFHTGRFVGTGTQGANAARLAIARAQLQLAQEANVHVHVRNFQVINSVGAVSLHASLNCDAFASDHSSEAHFDRASFVGLAWRPRHEHICCGTCFAWFHGAYLRILQFEIYSTGRANLPGSVVERGLLDSFSRMLPELLRYSSKRFLLDIIPQELQEHHKVKPMAPLEPITLRTAPVTTVGRARQHLVPKAPAPKKPIDLWAEWDDASPAMSSGTQFGDERGERSDEDLDLTALGL